MKNSESSVADAQAGFKVLTSDCGLYELNSRAKIVLTGEDRVRWLNGMITNNVRDLAVGHGVYGFLLNPQGRILGDLYAFNRDEYLLVDTDHSQLPRILEIFERYIIMDDVVVENITENLSGIGIAGPKAEEILKASNLFHTGLAALQFADLTWRDVGPTLVRKDNPAIPVFELWATPSNLDALWSALSNAGGKSVSQETLELLRIASGVPRYGVDIRERDLPQETEQQRALNFNKGCYIGQEIVERIRSRGAVHRTFAGFQVEGPMPSAGEKIFVDSVNDKEVGEITSTASITSGSVERSVALGYIRREAAGGNLRAGQSTLMITTLPFKDFFKQ